MKYENISQTESIIRLTIGVMMFMLFWLQMLGHIKITESNNVLFLILVISAYLLITGSSRICPIYHLTKKLKK